MGEEGRERESQVSGVALLCRVRAKKEGAVKRRRTEATS